MTLVTIKTERLLGNKTQKVMSRLLSFLSCGGFARKRARRFFSCAVWLLCLPAMTWAQTKPDNCAPGITFASLLGAVGIGYTSGKLEIESLYAICLPTPGTPSRSPYPYDPDGGGKLSTVLKREDGTTLTTYVWSAESIGGLWALKSYKVLGGSSAVVSLNTGKYTLEFQLEGKPFYRFPFSVTTMPSDDPYQSSGTRYFLEGAWNEYGNLFYQRNDPESPFRFTTWLQDKRGDDQQRSVPYEIVIVRKRDGKTVAQDTATLRLVSRWQKADLLFHPAGGDKNSYLKAGDILREDGTYSVHLSLEGTRYGTYQFIVRGGRIELQGRQVRAQTNPMDVMVESISAGRYTSWWITREQ